MNESYDTDIMVTELRADDIKRFLEEHTYDLEGAAKYLEVETNSVEVAAHRGRLPHVTVPSKKMFAKADLDEYRRRRAPGRASRLDYQPPFRIRPR